MGIFRRIIASLLVMLIIIGGSGVLVCELHECCRKVHDVEHVCCKGDHASQECESKSDHDDCVMHKHHFSHKCHDVDPLTIESTTPDRGSKISSLAAIYICICNLFSLREEESVDLVAWCDVLIDRYNPSDGLLRAPPALL